MYTDFHDCEFLLVFEAGWFKATLYIPRLPRLSSVTLTAWKNSLAYEALGVHLQKDSESQFIAILAFMDNLMETKDDVSILLSWSNGIISYIGGSVWGIRFFQSWRQSYFMNNYYYSYRIHYSGMFAATDFSPP